jgi:hypothetical protein
MFGLGAPVITQAQIAAAIAWVVSQLVAMGVLDEDSTQLVLSASSSLLAAAWMIGDAILRANRAKAAAMAAAAQVPLAEIHKEPGK